MPRTAKRQTLSGQPAQPIGAVPGQEYGMGVAQMDLQRALPAPDVQPAQAPAPPAAVPVPAGQPSPDVMSIAKAMPGGPGLFNEPDDRPVTAGLSMGPGAGPSVLNMPGPTPIGETLKKLSEWTGDTYFAELARKNGI